MKSAAKKRFVVSFAAIVFFWSAGAHAEQASLKGVALVIGQSKYEHISALPNPANDAREMVKLLSDLGFDARSVSDRDTAKLKRDLERFVEDAEGADVAFLYYSGHGIESGGENWLIPVNADVSSLENAGESLVPISAVMDELKAIVPVTILLLDACRTNPFPEDAIVKRVPSDPGTPIGAGGLTPVRGATALGDKAPVAAADNLGTVIGFAAEPGRPALDGPKGENSPYASALLRHLGAMNGLEFGAVMRMVTEEVYLDTKTQQRPWVNESLRRLLYFGAAVEEPTGDDGLITGERRQLLLTISELPDLNRAQVETVAAKDGVPLDALYGVLRALGQSKIPSDPTELETVLDAQAERLKKMLAESDALRTDDPEIARLTASADRAIQEGAIVTARKFLDDAVKRVEETSGAVDAAEEEIKQKRIADAAVYAKRADASALAFDFLSAADDYAKAFDLIEKWDEKLRWNYKNMEAEALNAHGGATGNRRSLKQAIDAYEDILDFLPRDDNTSRDWAITRNNMAVVMQTLGERESTTESLDGALVIFRESLAVFEREKDDVNWAAAQNNIGNVLLNLGERRSDNDLLEQAVEAFRASLARRDRGKVPLDWASSQNNIGITLNTLAEREAGEERLVEAEAAYRAALEVYTRQAHPREWAMTMNNLGNTLNLLGSRRNDVKAFEQAAAMFQAAMEVRTRETFPILWAASQINLGNAYHNIGQMEAGTTNLEAAAAAYNAALEVLDRREAPMDWASAQNNLGSVLQTLGQRNMDTGKIKESVAAFRLALEEYRRDRSPADWAMGNFNLGNSLQLVGISSQDPAVLKEALGAYRSALEEYDREEAPRNWALAQNGMGATLQSLASHEDMIPNLNASVEARRAGLEILTRENSPVEWATAQNGLGTCLLNLSTFDRKPEYLPEAKAAFEAAKLVFTREAQPLQWAFAENNIGDVHWALATSGGGKPEFEKALVLFESAKKAFDEAGYAPVIALIDQKIALVNKSLAQK